MVWNSTNPYGPVTVTVAPEGGAAIPSNGMGNPKGELLAWIGENAVGPGWSVDVSTPTWIPIENTMPGLTWSGGAYGQGSPSITSTGTP